MTNSLPKISGWINFYKERGQSSNKNLTEVKKIFYSMGYTRKMFKIGYLGTLDPFAEGILPIAIGEALKTIQFIPNEDKSYDFILKFGEETDTLDNTGKVTNTTDIIPSEKEVKDVLTNFLGEIEQIPPAFSALKINGERAYKLAREGKKFEIKKRKILIRELRFLEKISDYEYKISVKCSKGTYVRTLGADIAKSLNSLGHLTFLERTYNSGFDKKESISLDNIKKMLQNEGESKNDADSMIKILDKIDSPLDGIPVLSINENDKYLLETGRSIKRNNSLNDQNQIIRCHYNNHLVAICKLEQLELKPLRVFNIS
ncbi:MAG: tRNA pseudouridine(55) synthase TruB [Alphaproteobacteria bacterium]|jgi:tRNA pseudouridine55 synthase|nr:tRNA pseudouridine(55) synthase TruB [Alphaproteobacteria bacterium]